VRSRDIYWGAIPWLILQLMLVAILIAWPELVTFLLDAETVVDPNIQIIVPDSTGGDLSAPPTIDLGQPPVINPN
jgi:hypothetical protein